MFIKLKGETEMQKQKATRGQIKNAAGSADSLKQLGWQV